MILVLRHCGSRGRNSQLIRTATATATATTRGCSSSYRTSPRSRQSCSCPRKQQLVSPSPSPPLLLLRKPTDHHDRFHCRRTSSSSSTTSGNKTNNKRDPKGGSLNDTYGLPFTVSPEEAIHKFYAWAHQEQGLQYLLRTNQVQITAAYCPVWSFDVNIRFIARTMTAATARFDWKPSMFSIYGTQPVVHIPGLAAYAGYTYPRSFINPIHNVTLVFLGDQCVPFGSWMLRPMPRQHQQTKSNTNTNRANNSTTDDRLEIYPDPWNTSRAQAFQVIREELMNIVNAEIASMVKKKTSSSSLTVEIQTEVVSSRRVYMPTYVIDYQLLFGGIQFQAYLSGCDQHSTISGYSHKLMDWSQHQQKQQMNPQTMSFFSSTNTNSSSSTTSFWTNASSIAQQTLRVLSTRDIGMITLIVLRFLGGLLGRIWPLVGVFAGLFVGFRKILQPYQYRWSISNEWQNIRVKESHTRDDYHTSHVRMNDFVDNGMAQQYFKTNRGKILQYLNGTYDHASGDYDWYKQWEQWARNQWEQQQQQQQQSRQQQSYDYSKGQKSQPKQTATEYVWDFDPNDPFSVLGIHHGASQAEISAAFRREMMKHHPDVYTNASTPAIKDRATERTKLITNAYRKLKSITTKS